MRIKVTASHRKEGARQSSDCCPIALAACEQHGIRMEDIDVDRLRIFARDRRGRMRKYSMPPEASRWIDIFDFGSEAEVEVLPEIDFIAVRE